MGGRKLTKDLNISPEKEWKRRKIREMNNAASARSRKCRADHINSLVWETKELERIKQCFLNEIQEMQHQKEKLECLLNNHRGNANCSRNTRSPPDVNPFDYMYLQQQQNGIHERVKTEYVESAALQTPDMDSMFLLPSPTMLSSTVPISKPSRPNSLNVGATAPHLKNEVNELTGIAISTPSTGMIFNFESLMDGGTGLTPVSSQQRNIPTSIADISSPDACGPPK